MTNGAEIRFAPFGDRRIAFVISGEGPALVAPAWWVSHLELDGGDDAFRGFWESVAAGHRLIRYDRLGVGLSDRDVEPADLTLDNEVAMLAAVLDESGCERATLLGGSSGGCAAVAFAARSPRASRTPDAVRRVRRRGVDRAAGRARGDRRHRALALGLGFAVARRTSSSATPAAASRSGSRAISGRRRAPSTAAALLEHVYRNDVRDRAAARAGPDAGRSPSRRPRDPVPARARARGLDPRRESDPARGHAPTSRGRATADSVSRAVRAAFGDGDRPATAGSAGVLLSRREREVLALVAQGLTDREIAEQLIVSPHTVHRHVANIRHKLGRGSRTAAVAEAGRLGLL